MSVPPPEKPSVIYDIGSNNGDDIPYYLLKAPRVVAVEANPDLCAKIHERFKEPILAKRLTVVNAAVVVGNETEVDFFVHKQYHVLSTLQPPDEDRARYESIRVNAITVPKLLQSYGLPYYIKIDIEGYDEQVLASLAASRIKPPYISAECHRLGVFVVLSEQLGYSSFKLVDGKTVASAYGRALFRSPVLNKTVGYSFPHHSAGPFGNDIFGGWMDQATMLKVLALQGLGWKDLHASCVDPPTLRF